MAQDRHHYVPQFYLRRFTDDPKLLSVHNLGRGKTFRGPLRDQGYRHRFHGPDANVEQFFTDLEGRSAPVFRTFESCVSVPNEAEELATLRAFMTIQSLRTPTADAEHAAHIKQMAESLIRTQAETEGIDISSGFTVHAGSTLLNRLQSSAEFSEDIKDLHVLIVRAPPGFSFLTSDNPVVRYNQYSEAVTDRGTTGFVQSGLQLFLPLSPRRLIALHDDEKYATTATSSGVVDASPDDVATLNLLQAVFCDENLFFHTVADKELLSLTRRARPYRKVRVVKFRTFDREGPTKTAEVVQMNTPTPAVGLKLSFLRVRKKELRAAPRERYGFRAGHELPTGPPPPSGRFRLAREATTKLTK